MKIVGTNSGELTIVVDNESLIVSTNSEVELSIDQVLKLIPAWQQLADAIQEKIKTEKLEHLDDLRLQRDTLDIQIKDIEALQ